MLWWVMNRGAAVRIGGKCHARLTLINRIVNVGEPESP